MSTDPLKYATEIYRVAEELFDGNSIRQFPLITGNLRVLLRACAIKGERYREGKSDWDDPQPHYIENMFTSFGIEDLKPCLDIIHVFMESSWTDSTFKIEVGTPHVHRTEFDHAEYCGSTSSRSTFMTSNVDALREIIDTFKPFTISLTYIPTNGLWYGYYRYKIHNVTDQMLEGIDADLYWHNGNILYTNSDDVVLIAKIFGLNPSVPRRITVK